jgi:uncharacterized protein (DUF1778 family)
MSTVQSPDARLNVRLRSDIKERIERAAYVSGQSVSNFAVSTLAQAADEILKTRETIVLADADRDFFLALLDADDPPTEKELAAAARYNKGRRVGSEYHWEPE